MYVFVQLKCFLCFSVQGVVLPVATSLGKGSKPSEIVKAWQQRKQSVDCAFGPARGNDESAGVGGACREPVEIP